MDSYTQMLEAQGKEYGLTLEQAERAHYIFAGAEPDTILQIHTELDGYSVSLADCFRWVIENR